MVTQKYNTAGRQLLDQARAELYQGDIRQASEKGWGAAAQMVEAVAKSRGWPHRHHGLLTPPIETPCRRNQRLRAYPKNWWKLAGGVAGKRAGVASRLGQ